uniref:Uncharacterized protein n=2 Tax=Picea TaxID=3328 RepID=A0A101M5C0_PICGL|nr:hypothetical protein ABT39_MTgene1070 [Picea glauca]QHR90003.1 hypothetical protein Q903MT_gene4026 [Picea sitchensis]
MKLLSQVLKHVSQLERKNDLPLCCVLHRTTTCRNELINEKKRGGFQFRLLQRAC